MENKVPLFTVNTKAVCLKCGNKGAIQPYGNFYPQEKELSHVIGFGGTIPHRCMNCGNYGLVDFGGLEGYKQAFKTKVE